MLEPLSQIALERGGHLETLRTTSPPEVLGALDRRMVALLCYREAHVGQSARSSASEKL